MKGLFKNGMTSKNTLIVLKDTNNIGKLERAFHSLRSRIKTINKNDIYLHVHIPVNNNNLMDIERYILSNCHHKFDKKKKVIIFNRSFNLDSMDFPVFLYDYSLEFLSDITLNDVTFRKYTKNNHPILSCRGNILIKNVLGIYGIQIDAHSERKRILIKDCKSLSRISCVALTASEYIKLINCPNLMFHSLTVSTKNLLISECPSINAKYRLDKNLFHLNAEKINIDEISYDYLSGFAGK